MKKLILTVCLCVISPALFARPDWWNEPYPQRFESAQLESQTTIRVERNRFVNETGSTFIFRGVNIADPDKLVKQDQWKESLFDELASNWAVNTVRIPVHPVAWREHGPDSYLKLLDQAVVWANKRDLYLIIDWHSIGYLPTEQYQHPMYDTTQKETRDFWRRIAYRYKDVPTVAVYELFNEPTTQDNTLGRRDWKEWKALNESLIDMIYAQDKTAIPLVAGFNWAYDLTHVRKQPIKRDGVAYAVHPYPQKAKPEVPSKENFFKLWQQSWGYVADRHPMIATELGWVGEDGYGAHVPVINDGTYGPQIVEFMEERGISWTVWVFDPDWSPTMIEDWDFTPTEQGSFFKQALQDIKSAAP